MAKLKLSRRTVVSAGAGAMSLRGAAAALPRLPDAIRQLSAEWLALKQREEVLTARWSAVESLLIEHFGWPDLTEHEQETLPEADELREIDEQLDQLEEQRRACWARLLDLPAATLEDTLGKLRITVDLIEPADQPLLHQLLSHATDELEWLLARSAPH